MDSSLIMIFKDQNAEDEFASLLPIAYFTLMMHFDNIRNH